MTTRSRPELPDAEARRVIATSLDLTLLVEAAAGTGKTTSMIQRMVALLAEGVCPISSMAAVTFTRKATAELRDRFQVSLEAQVRAATGRRRDLLAEALSRIEQCFIGTIHAFCGRLLRERPIEAGVNVAFEELDEDQEYRLREAAWGEHTDRLHAEGAPILGRLRELGLDLSQLRDAYLTFADYPDVDRWPAEPVEIDAGLVDRARGEVRRLAAHAAAISSELPEHAGRDELIPFYRDLPRRVRNTALSRPQELMALLEECRSVNTFVLKNWPGGQPRGRLERDQWQTFQRSCAQPLVDQWHRRRYGPVLEALCGAARHYERLRAQRGVLSYQDLLMKAARLLRSSDHIRAYFRRRFTHLLVDEFQDTDPVQAEVMMLLTADDDGQMHWRQCRPRPGALFVVGDPKQSIYRFRRADIVTYNQVHRIIERYGRVVGLTANFRSVKPLIDWVNGVSRGLFAVAGEFGPPDAQMHAARSDGSAADIVGPASFGVPDGRKADQLRNEADFIARSIRDAIDRGLTVPRRDGQPTALTPGDVLVLTWRREPLVAFADAMQACGLPVDVTGSSAVNDVPEVALLHALLSPLVDPDNPVAVVGALRSELFGVSDDELYRFKKAGGRFSFHRKESIDGFAGITSAFDRLQRYAGWLDAMQPIAAVERIAADAGLPARAAAAADGSARAGGLAKAVELLRVASRQQWTPAELVAYLARLLLVRPTERHDGMPLRPNRDAVRLMNLHQAKGLEAPVVFLAEAPGQPVLRCDLFIDRREDLVRGYFAVRETSKRRGGRGKLIAAPTGWAQLEQTEQHFQEAEHDRLRYVAATRAAAHLVISRNGPQWEKLIQGAVAGRVLPDPPPVPPAPEPSIILPADAPDVFARRVAARWERLKRPTYAVTRAKELAVRGGVKQVASGEHGTEWGTVIHVLLEAAMARPGADLAALAAAALEEQQLDPRESPRAVALVEAVTASALWRRARAADRCLVEVPIQFLEPATEAAPDTIVRGVIDLAFREPDGWVIADYKTDDRDAASLDGLVEHYAPQVRLYAEAWERLVGEPVHETGLFFVGSGEYRVVGPATTVARA